MKIYSFPYNYDKKSTDFEVTADGKHIGVYLCTVSACPFNQVWPGYQRPENQTENASFVMLGCDSEITLDIKTFKQYKTVIVRPSAKEIQPEILGEMIKIKFPGPGQYSVEFDGMHNTLAVFINPEKEFNMDIKNPDILYFGAGVHLVNKKIELFDNQTVFIDEGAVVYGAITAMDKKNVSVVGYGILDNSMMDRADAVSASISPEIMQGDKIGIPIFFNRCENVLIDGITIVDSSEWSVHINGCKNVIVDNIKLVGMWRYNADGCDFCNCTDVVMKNSFLRTFDDSVVIKGLRLNHTLPVENIFVENCVIWCDWGRALELGAETSAPYFNNIIFKNCDIIHSGSIMMDIQHGDRAKITDVKFEDIRIEYSGEEEVPAMQEGKDAVYPVKDEVYLPMVFAITAGSTMWSYDDRVGDISDIVFKDISIKTPSASGYGGSLIRPNDEKSDISNIRCENFMVNGSVASWDELSVELGETVKEIYYNNIKIK